VMSEQGIKRIAKNRGVWLKHLIAFLK